MGKNTNNNMSTGKKPPKKPSATAKGKPTTKADKKAAAKAKELEARAAAKAAKLAKKEKGKNTAAKSKYEIRQNKVLEYRANQIEYMSVISDNKLDALSIKNGKPSEPGDPSSMIADELKSNFDSPSPFYAESDNSVWRDDYPIKNDQFKPKPFINNGWDDVFKSVHKSVMIPEPSGYSLKDHMSNVITKKYDRFKMPDPNLPLQRGFPHVFFTRPNCNIFDDAGKGELTEVLTSKDIFKYILNYNIDLLYQLSGTGGGYGHDFMMSLSNLACSFSNSDEYITTGQYGSTYTGFKISYGRHDIESRTAGTCTIEFKDTRNLDIYFIHRLWTQYISGVYRGEIYPKSENIIKKILDYAGSIYYIVTAEDNETVLFWTKYYGVFPTTVPSAHPSWGKGNVITSEDFTIEYQYSFKEDCNPYTIFEFNHNSRVGKDTKFVPTYNPYTNSASDNWVGRPFITYDEKSRHYKLRFERDPDETDPEDENK